MASGAILAEAAAMNVVAAVAIDALRTLSGRIAGPRMAGRTDQAAMPSGQRKRGGAIVIEGPGLPVGGVVTALALCRRAEASGMVPVIMARRARHAPGRKALVGMTGGTLQRSMFAQQREAGQPVIEANANRPAINGMAALAIPAKLAPMNVVSGMAGAALRR